MAILRAIGSDMTDLSSAFKSKRWVKNSDALTNQRLWAILCKIKGGNYASTHSFAELSDLCHPNPSLLGVYPFDLIVRPQYIIPWADALHSVYVFLGKFSSSKICSSSLPQRTQDYYSMCLFQLFRFDHIAFRWPSWSQIWWIMTARNVYIFR